VGILGYMGNVLIDTHRTAGMSDATLDDRGRLTLPKEMRERYGDHYRIVQVHDGIKLIPVADDPLDALRDEFSDVEETASGTSKRGTRNGAGRGWTL